MTCAHCGRDLKLSSIVGYLHADYSYWCFPDEEFHAMPDDEANNVLFCSESRSVYGF
jgi:hypothetical protein